MSQSHPSNSSSQAPVGDSPIGPNEPELWRQHGAEWRQLYGNFRELGVSFEWHQFESAQELNWASSFHPESLEVCLNLQGKGTLRDSQSSVAIEDHSVAYYYCGAEPLMASRSPGQGHRFVSVEFSPRFLARFLDPHRPGLDPLVLSVIRGEAKESRIGLSQRLTSAQIEMVGTLSRPPVYAAAQPLWYQAKALEVASVFFYRLPDQEELFCRRQQHVAADRVQRVYALLKAHLAEPLTLEALARQVGCSPFYLSRTFSSEVGMTIPQCLRALRMERAAELLKSGKYNVTEAALEVGYNSLSHFSHTFQQTYGCCPGLYPVMKPATPPTPLSKRTKEI